jgi:hypothetical protein
VLIAVESVYSMDGDFAPLQELDALARAYEAVLVVDEAHATGVFGARGRGCGEGLHGPHWITLHTGGKALGVAGALICANADTIDYLINRARPLFTAPRRRRIWPPPSSARCSSSTKSRGGASACCRWRPWLAGGFSSRTAPHAEVRSCPSSSTTKRVRCMWPDNFRRSGSTSAPSGRPRFLTARHDCASRFMPITAKVISSRSPDALRTLVAA